MTEMTQEGFQAWAKSKLDDIDCDTDALLEMHKHGGKMTDGLDMGILGGMLGNRGIDPGIVAMLNDKCKDGGWGEQGGIWIILLFLFLLGIGGGNGFFGNNKEGAVGGVDRTVINEANYTRLLDAITANGTRQEAAVRGLADSLGCDMNSVQTALAGVDKQIALSGCNIQNAIQSCCCTLQSSIDKCCCETNLNIERSANNVINTIQAQTNAVQAQFASQNAYLADQFCQIKLREQERIIADQREKILVQSQDAQTRILLDAIERKAAGGFYDQLAGRNN